VYSARLLTGSGVFDFSLKPNPVQVDEGGRDGPPRGAYNNEGGLLKYG